MDFYSKGSPLIKEKIRQSIKILDKDTSKFDAWSKEFDQDKFLSYFVNMMSLQKYIKYLGKEHSNIFFQLGKCKKMSPTFGQKAEVFSLIFKFGQI